MTCTLISPGRCTAFGTSGAVSTHTPWCYAFGRLADLAGQGVRLNPPYLHIYVLSGTISRAADLPPGQIPDPSNTRA
jgi:hypothetical protein